MKTNKEIAEKCNEIIDLLKDFSIPEKYKVVKELYASFLENCKAMGIKIAEIDL